MTLEPAYLELSRGGELEQRASRAVELLASCDLCARYCHVDRLESARGAVCRTGRLAVVHSFGPHHGEERPLRGRGGSGTIFLSWCNLRCVFCQNWETSQEGTGREVEAEELATMMLALQEHGCHNVNFVTPSHVVAQILEAVAIAAREGLCLPLVYNTGGYDSLEALRLLDGVIDVFGFARSYRQGLFVTPTGEAFLGSASLSLAFPPVRSLGTRGQAPQAVPR